MSEETNWALFYEKLSSPTCEFYEQMATIGSAFFTYFHSLALGDAALADQSMGIALARAAEAYNAYPDLKAVTAMVVEIVEAHQGAEY